MKKVYLVLLSERLNKIANVKNKRAIGILKNETATAMTEAIIGNQMCILACSFSILVNGIFSMVVDRIAY